MLAKIPALPNPRSDYIRFAGGLDTETPRWRVEPGKLQDSQNYEMGLNGGYIRIEGYERFDGQPSPSSAAYLILNVTISGSFSDGDTVTGATSGATGVVVAVVTSGSPNYLVLTKISGTFVDTENLEVSASVEGVAASDPMPAGASTTLLNAQYNNLAADSYRDDITAVPGSGPVLGVVYHNDTVYAFRNNLGGTAANIYQSSVSGWTQVVLGSELSFTSGGTTEITEGDTITGLTSGATADVDRVVLLSGTWAAGDAVGKFILSNQSGTFQSENIEVSGSGSIGTIAGDSSAISLSPGGRYEFWIANFGGQSGTRRVYGCDGVNRGFEFDGSVFTPIDTGVAVDAPTHVTVHKNHLFFSFGSSAQHSGIGAPYVWSPVFGAAELATGDTITGFMPEPGAQGGATLGIYNRNTIHVLYGSSSLDWELVRFRDEVGAYAHSLQQIGTTFFLDDRGVNSLRTAQEYGNFTHATLTRQIQSFINLRKLLISASCISRDKSQYRIFFSDGYGLFLTLDGNKITGVMPVNFTDPATCATSVENASGAEVMFFGDENGFVHQMDRGTSFDGDNILSFLDFHYSFSGSIRSKKKYLDVTFETEGEGYSAFDFSYELDYASTRTAQPLAVSVVKSFNPVYWDQFVWDQFVWDGQSLGPETLKLTGSAENISFTIRSNSDYFSSIQFNGAYMAYIPRRRLR